MNLYSEIFIGNYQIYKNLVYSISWMDKKYINIMSKSNSNLQFMKR